jgi:pimeloyl-ACP methyl ester carboxylesterase
MRIIRILLGTLLLLVAGLSGGYLWSTYRTAVNADRYPAPGLLVDVGGGRRLHLLCKGSGAGPTVVIEPGLADTSANFWPIQDAIAGFARVCTYDRAGYAWSDPAPPDRPMEDVARDLHALLTNAEIAPPYVLVAHSLGGFYTRLFARDFADEVDGMVLIDASEEGFNMTGEGLALVGYLEATMTAAQWAARFGVLPLMLAVMGGPASDLPANAAAMNLRPSELIAAADEIAATTRVSPEMRRPGGLGALGDIPLIVLSHDPKAPNAPGREDDWTAAQKRLAGLSTNSERIVALQSGHLVYREKPMLVVDAVRRVFVAARDGGRVAPAAGRR